ncbi:hypothetical protein ROMU108268_21815 [Roseomonas mucosa]
MASRLLARIVHRAAPQLRRQADGRQGRQHHAAPRPRAGGKGLAQQDEAGRAQQHRQRHGNQQQRDQQRPVRQRGGERHAGGGDQPRRHRLVGQQRQPGPLVLRQEVVERRAGEDIRLPPQPFLQLGDAVPGQAGEIRPHLALGEGVQAGQRVERHGPVGMRQVQRHRHGLQRLGDGEVPLQPGLQVVGIALDPQAEPLPQQAHRAAGALLREPGGQGGVAHQHRRRLGRAQQGEIDREIPARAVVQQPTGLQHRIGLDQRGHREAGGLGGGHHRLRHVLALPGQHQRDAGRQQQEPGGEDSPAPEPEGAQQFRKRHPLVQRDFP